MSWTSQRHHYPFPFVSLTSGAVLEGRCQLLFATKLRDVEGVALAVAEAVDDLAFEAAIDANHLNEGLRLAAVLPQVLHSSHFDGATRSYNHVVLSCFRSMTLPVASTAYDVISVRI